MKQNRDPEATKAAILDAAEKKFLKRGYGATAISEIAKKAGITKSLVHHYFGSKQGLWHAVKMRRMMEYAEEQKDILEHGNASLELLVDSLESYFRFLKKTPQLIRIMAWMFLEQDQDECIDLDRELIQVGVAKVQEGQQLGLLRSDIDSRFLTFIFIGLVQQWFQNRDHFIQDFGIEGLPDNLDEPMLEAIKKIFFEGILPR